MTSPAKPAGSSPSPSLYYHDIDGARSVLMFLSVALHAGTVYAPARPWITPNADRHEFFDWLIFGFHLFITPTFFFVGGFFAVLLLKRRTIVDFARNRLLRTAVPLAAIALSLNMIEHYLRWVDAGAPGGGGDDAILTWLTSGAFAQVWASGLWQLHLWFLVSLLPMFALAALVHGAVPKEARIRQAACRFADRLGTLFVGNARFVLVLFALALVNTANYAAASLVPGSYALIAPGFQSFYKLASEFPFFVLGVLAALSPRLLGSLFEWRGWMPYAAFLALLLQPYPGEGDGFATGMAMLFANQLAIWTIVLFILQFFRRFFSAGGPRTAWLADCALSMYLFHHCIVYVLGREISALEWPIAIEFTLLTFGTAAIVILLHEGCIRRFALARLLFNGKTDIAQTRSAPGLIASFSPGRSKDAKAGAGGVKAGSASAFPR